MNPDPSNTFETVSLASFFDKNQNLLQSRLDSFLDTVIDLKAMRHGIRPDTLIRVVHGGEIHWFTQEQADHYLRLAAGEADFKRAIEKALKGETKWIRQELAVLLEIADRTLKRFRGDPGVDNAEVNRIGAVLEKSRTEMERTFEAIAAHEEHIESIRSKNPFIRQYEILAGQFLDMRRNGREREAARIAHLLIREKNAYLINCRSIAPDQLSIQLRRIDLQKIKKRMLGMYRYLVEQKVGGLQWEIDSLKRSLEAGGGGDAEAPEGGAASEGIVREIREKEEEKRSFETETEIGRSIEARTSRVIEEMEVILQNGNGERIDETVREARAQGSPRIAPKCSENPAKKNANRMATADLHRKKR